ncbi:NUDIX hydrolase [uncultured Roseobacter sp.]|uniref:NUDIX hydrolase n=1 Tax=uncultured Roseobacter sp. TaxID=114847 RepID=UPI00260BF31F|nr:NUDIX hydrolase [uncultured Roseobacter sp.]
MVQPYASADEMNMPFTGAKLALLIGRGIITILRDDRTDIPYPGHWDLPGGGREGAETPLNCALRETREELGLDVPPDTVCWHRFYQTGDQSNWFFVARLALGAEQTIVFGDEGQCWRVMEVAEFLRHPGVVPRFQERLQDFLEEGVS